MNVIRRIGVGLGAAFALAVMLFPAAERVAAASYGGAAIVVAEGSPDSSDGNVWD